MKNKMIEIILNKIKECDKLEEECETKIRKMLQMIEGEPALYTSILNALHQYLKYLDNIHIRIGILQDVLSDLGKLDEE